MITISCCTVLPDVSILDIVGWIAEYSKQQLSALYRKKDDIPDT